MKEGLQRFIAPPRPLQPEQVSKRALDVLSEFVVKDLHGVGRLQLEAIAQTVDLLHILLPEAQLPVPAPEAQLPVPAPEAQLPVPAPEAQMHGPAPGAGGQLSDAESVESVAESIEMADGAVELPAAAQKKKTQVYMLECGSCAILRLGSDYEAVCGYKRGRGVAPGGCLGGGRAEWNSTIGGFLKYKFDPSRMEIMGGAELSAARPGLS